MRGLKLHYFFLNGKIKTKANNAYSYLLVLCVLGKSYRFSSGSFSFDNSVLVNAISYTQTRSVHKTNTHI